jgi:hypothetical protein
MAAQPASNPKGAHGLCALSADSASFQLNTAMIEWRRNPFQVVCIKRY